MNTIHPLRGHVLAVATAAVLPVHAWAHVTLEQGSAVAGAAFKAVLLVNHGCQGSATQALTVRMPAGLRGVRPMAKAGWTVTLQRAAPAASAPAAAAGDITEVRWQANGREAMLPDALFDAFVLAAQAPATPGPLWFKVLQQCEQGQIDWAEVPATGTDIQGLKTPALLLDVQPAPAGSAGHAGHQH